MATEAASSWLGAIALPALAVVVVLAAGLIVVAFGFRPTAEPPTLEIVADDRKGKKKRKEPQREKKQANGQVAHEGDAKSKKATDSKKSPAKSKEQDKKSKEKAAEPKSAPAKQTEKKSPPPPKKEAVKKQKERAVKPADYDEGEWEKVPSRSDKKKKNQEENKKESPTKKKGKDGKKETFVEEKKADRPEPPPIPKDLQEKVNELQRVLNEVERRDRSQTPIKLEDTSESSAPPTPDLKEKKKKEKIVVEDDDEIEFSPPKPQKSVKKQVSESSDEPAPVEKSTNEPVFDELGDTWTDAKLQKKGKKKTRKDQ